MIGAPGDAGDAPCSPEEEGDPWPTESTAITSPPTVSTERSQGKSYAFESEGF